MEISDFSGDSIVSYDLFLKTVLWQDDFGNADTGENALLRPDNWCFSGTKACDVFLEWILERTHGIWKMYANSVTVEDAVWYWFTFLLLLIVVCSDAVKRKSPKNFCWCISGFWCICWLGQLAEPGRCFWIKLALLIHECFAQGDQTTVVDLCELNCWYPENADWIQPQEIFLNKAPSSFIPISLKTKDIYAACPSDIRDS